jgi:hypothetical protein
VWLRASLCIALGAPLGAASGGCGLVLDVDPPSDAGTHVEVDAASDGGRRRSDAGDVSDGGSRADAPRASDGGGRGDASVSDASWSLDGGSTMCIGYFESVGIVCTRVGGAMVEVRADLVAHFDGCGCVRAVIRVENAAGTAWNISDEDVGTDGTVRFDASQPFTLGGASTDLPYSVEVCCYDAAGTGTCVMAGDVSRAPCM